MAQDKNDKGVIGLKLANGKVYEGTCGFEMLCFYESDGASIVPGKKKSKSKRGKIKGKGRKAPKGEKKKRQVRHLT